MRVPSLKESKNQPTVVRASQIGWITPQSGAAPNIAFDEWLASFDPETSLIRGVGGDSARANNDELLDGKSTAPAELATEAAASGLISPTGPQQRQDSPPPRRAEEAANDGEEGESQRQVRGRSTRSAEGDTSVDVLADAVGSGAAGAEADIQPPSEALSADFTELDEEGDVPKDQYQLDELQSLAPEQTLNNLSDSSKSKSRFGDEQDFNDTNISEFNDTNISEFAEDAARLIEGQGSLKETQPEDAEAKLAVTSTLSEEEETAAINDQTPQDKAAEVASEEIGNAVSIATPGTNVKGEGVEEGQTPFTMQFNGRDGRGEMYQQNQSDSELADQPSQDQMLSQAAALQARQLVGKADGTASIDIGEGIKGIASASQPASTTTPSAAVVPGASNGRHAATSASESSHVGGDGRSTAARELPKGVEAKVMERVEAILRALGEAKDGSKLSFRLDPPDLGTVTVDISLAQGELRARLVAESPEVAQLLRERASELQVALRKAGIDADRVTVSTAGGDSAFSDSSSFENSNLSDRGEQRGWQRSLSAWQDESWMMPPLQSGSVTEVHGSLTRKGGWIA